MRRTEIDSSHLLDLGFVTETDPAVLEPAEIEIKYAGYVKRQMELIAQAKKFDDLVLPTDLDFGLVKGLSREETEKLAKVRPRTLGQAGRISGVNPSAVQAIMIFLKGIAKRQEAARESVGQVQG